ncbi:MAG: 5,10-methylenetetrahydrofolate reductase [Arsenicicoccus sp.]|uniref:methylenetetrahydrofolate reductase n=1 Tax=Serinicoccus profundi TaxID=1078471 RepID=UPI000255E6BC|nr:methylenetetrahydrofolate reductase [Serinicoccus profundi]PZU42742.1 MAG: 5,10-methylenetetrahydrofolate reductase [Arsenicicoccus sp.]
MSTPRTRISVELVPRSEESVRAEMQQVSEHLTGVDTINIPDLVKFELRSWAATQVARESTARGDGTAYRTIPHIRAADVDPDAPLPMAAEARRTGELLVVSGDDADYFHSATYPVDAVDVIRRIRAELPEVRIYAGLDPYRQSMTTEMRYLDRKLAAGASGIFTQPFFDTHLMAAWASVLPRDIPVWWGATSVTTDGAMGYWRRRNRVVFPGGFDTSMTWQRDFARRVVDFARERGHHAYLMPVRAPLLDYLGGVLDGS